MNHYSSIHGYLPIKELMDLMEKEMKFVLITFILSCFFSSSISFAQVVSENVKLKYSESALKDILRSRNLSLIPNSINIKTSCSPLQIPLQVVDLISTVLPIGNTNNDFEVVHFNAKDEKGNVHEGWIHLYAATAKGCMDECVHQLNYPTAKEVTRSNGDKAYLRLFNLNSPKSIHDMDIHLSSK